MVATSCNTDLIDINLGDGTWVEPTGAIAGGGPAAETDYFIEGTQCQSESFNALGLGGMCIDKTGSNTTIASGNASFHWLYWGAPNTIGILNSGGYRILIGSLTTAYKMFPVLGSDTYIYGGWENHAVNPQVSTGFWQGSTTVSTSVFGSVVYNVNKVGKGNPYGNDAIRHGRTLRIVGGDVTNGYSTFVSASGTNDSINNRWGLFQAISGGYLQKGLFLMGTATLPVDFRDSNKVISIQDTTRVQAGFNSFEVRNAASRVDWTNIQITTLGVTSKGTFTVTDNADINFDTCTFTDMDTFIFKALSTILTTTFRRCGQVTQGTGIFTSCRFENSTGIKALLIDDITKVTNCDFISSGTGYAIEGFSAAGDYNLETLSFTNYAGSSGTTGNEAIHVLAESGIVNLSCTGTPSVHSAGATVNIISGSVNATVTVKDSSTPPVAIENAMVLVLADSGGPMPYNVTVTIVNDGTLATVTHNTHGMLSNDKVRIKGASLPANNGVFTITKINDNSYSYTMGSSPGSSPTGTIKCDYVALYGLTNASGVRTMSRVFSSNQPIIGRVRKSTGSPLYKTASFVGEINFQTGYAATIQMILDE